MSDNASAAAALAGAGGNTHAVAEESEQAAVLALAAAAAARKVGGGAVRAGTDGSSPLAPGPATKSLNSGGLSGGDVISALSEDGTDDDPNDQQAQGGLSGQRNSGSLSNLASADWRGGHSSEGLPQPLPAPEQQQQQQHAHLPYAAQHGLDSARQAALMQQAMAQAAAAAAATQQHGHGLDATPSTARGRRNARQQEQNKQVGAGIALTAPATPRAPQP